MFRKLECCIGKSDTLENTFISSTSSADLELHWSQSPPQRNTFHPHNEGKHGRTQPGTLRRWQEKKFFICESLAEEKWEK